MGNVRGVVGVMVVAGMLFLGVVDASAQVIGTFRWGLASYCNVVTLTVIQQGPALLASGFDDNCGLSTASPANGTFFLTGGNAIGSLNIVAADGVASTVRMQLSVSSISGTWVDSGGKSGSLTFNPSTAPGSERPVARDAWAYVIGNNGLFHASSGNLTATHPATGTFCIVMAKRYSHKAAQVTPAGPGSTHNVRVGTGHGSVCNPLSTDTEDVIPVYVKTSAGVAVDGDFTIVIPAR